MQQDVHLRDESGFDLSFNQTTRRWARKVKDMIEHGLSDISAELSGELFCTFEDFRNQAYIEGLLEKRQLNPAEQYILSLLKYIYNYIDFEECFFPGEPNATTQDRVALYGCLKLGAVSKERLSLLVGGFSVRYENLAGQSLKQALQRQAAKQPEPSTHPLTLFSAGVSAGAALVAVAFGVERLLRK